MGRNVYAFSATSTGNIVVKASQLRHKPMWIDIIHNDGDTMRLALLGVSLRNRRCVIGMKQMHMPQEMLHAMILGHEASRQLLPVLQ